MMSIRLSGLFGGMILSCGVVLGLTGLTGCATAPVDKGPVVYQMPSDGQLAAMRESMQKHNPGSLVGSVIVTLDDKNLAAVVGIPIKDVKLGQTINFADADGSPVSVGTVVGIVADPSTEDSVNVRFDATGKRPVHRGDLAVLLKE